MKKQGISQETLKLIACVTMLIDHIGAVFIRGNLLRVVGRLSFPIYCFLIAEGSHYTRDAKKYGLRLGLLAVLSELPFELAFFGGYTPYRQNVMLTLLLGFCALQLMKKCSGALLKVLAVVPFAFAAEYLHCDYGAEGVMLIAMFTLTRELPHQILIQFLGMLFIFSGMSSTTLLDLGVFSLHLQDLAVLSIVPIAMYSGKKATNSKAVQWGFYLFYPAHMLALYWIRLWME